jgi:hypothetical protein
MKSDFLSHVLKIILIHKVYQIYYVSSMRNKRQKSRKYMFPENYPGGQYILKSHKMLQVNNHIIAATT